MKKSNNLKHRLMALMLSVVLAATTLINSTAFSSKNVEASAGP